MALLEKGTQDVLKVIVIYFILAGLPNYLLISILELGLPDSVIGVINLSIVVVIAIIVIFTNKKKETGA